MELLIGLGSILLIVFIIMKEKFISLIFKKPILIPIKIKETNKQYKKRGNHGC